jgi:hypothetical protein
MRSRNVLATVAIALLTQAPAIEVRLVVDEPKAALAILDKRAVAKPIVEEDWQTLFKTEGYTRLKDRELGMGREFKEEDFRTFMQSEDLLAKRQALRDTLAKWQLVNIQECGARSLAYLPKGAKLRASVYFLVKPRTNSFVWDLAKNPAVMLYLDPEMSADELGMTIAHEFHHVGFAGVGYAKDYSEWLTKQSSARKSALTWQGAFGEGFAVLAAAGGPSPNPIAPARKQVRDAWDEGVKNLNRDMAELQRFFLDLLNDKLDAAKAQEKAVTYYGVQGPWYTVGYHMAVSIEKEFGRERLVECFIDPRKLLALYNEAAQQINSRGGKHFVWSDELLKKITR